MRFCSCRTIYCASHVMVCGKRVPAPLSVSGQEHYSVQQELIRKKGSHKQEHTGTQT